jgi:hypothetical protein
MRQAAYHLQNACYYFFGSDGVARQYEQQQPAYPRRPADPWARPGAMLRPGDTISGLAHVTYGPQQQPCPQQAAPVPDSPPASSRSPLLPRPRRGAQRAKGRRAGR